MATGASSHYYVFKHDEVGHFDDGTADDTGGDVANKKIYEYHAQRHGGHFSRGQSAGIGAGEGLEHENDQKDVQGDGAIGMDEGYGQRILRRHIVPAPGRRNSISN